MHMAIKTTITVVALGAIFYVIAVTHQVHPDLNALTVSSPASTSAPTSSTTKAKRDFSKMTTHELAAIDVKTLSSEEKQDYLKRAKELDPSLAKDDLNSTPATVTLSEFSKIQNGMTYEEVTQLLGGVGTMASEIGTKGSQFYTVGYTYKGEGLPGANVILMFQNGKLASKTQAGLQ